MMLEVATVIVKNGTAATESTESLPMKQVKDILDTLTPANFRMVVSDFLALDVHKMPMEAMKVVIDAIHNKAITAEQLDFIQLYGNLCQQQIWMETRGGEEEQKMGCKSAFRDLLLAKCQRMFETGKDEVLSQLKDQVKKMRNKNKRVRLQDKYKEVRSQRILGNMAFIGHLYCQDLLTARIIHWCVKKKLRQYAHSLDGEEEHVECVVRLLEVAGQRLDGEEGEEKALTNLVYAYLCAITCMVTADLRCKINNLIDLRAAKWMPRY